MTRTPEASIALHPSCCQLRIWGVYVLLPLCHFTDKAMAARERRLLLEPRRLSRQIEVTPNPGLLGLSVMNALSQLLTTTPRPGRDTVLAGAPCAAPFLSEQGSERQQGQQELVPPVLVDMMGLLCPVLPSFLGVPPSSSPEHPWSVSPFPFTLGSPGTCPWLRQTSLLGGGRY